MARPRVYDEALRQRLLDEVATMVAERGAARVTVRDLAGRADTSTAAIYALFGGRSGLFGELHTAGFRDFGQSQRATATGLGPLADIVMIAFAYRSWAQEHPRLYSVMFDGTLTSELPPGYDMAELWTSQRPLRDAVEQLIESAPEKPAANVDTVVASIWASAHGFVSLEVQDLLPTATDRDQAYAAICMGVLRHWLPHVATLDSGAVEPEASRTSPVRPE